MWSVSATFNFCLSLLRAMMCISKLGNVDLVDVDVNDVDIVDVDVVDVHH